MSCCHAYNTIAFRRNDREELALVNYGEKFVLQANCGKQVVLLK